MQLVMCWPGSSHLHIFRQKSNCSSHIVTLLMDVLFGVIHSITLRKVNVSYSDTFKHLINVSTYTSSSLTFAMNGTDHINVVFRKFAYSLMSRVKASHNSIVPAIVNIDAWISGRVCYMYRNKNRQNYPSICQSVVNDFIINQYRQHMISIPKLISIFQILLRLYCLYL